MATLVGRILKGRYRVERHLGEGGMSDVYMAKLLPQLTIPFAIKVLKPHFVHHTDFGRRFRGEAELLIRLDHPNIVRVHECFEESGLVCMVLAFVDGESLADRIRRQGAMDSREALPMFKAVLNALDYAHQQGVIHRDVKPSNILLDRDDSPMLCDFGIARQLGQRSLTGVGIKLGTPQYMSPEQVRGLESQPVDHRSDLYSAGIVLYEMLSGNVPFDSTSTRSEFEVLKQHVSEEPPDLRSINPRVHPMLAQRVHKALRKDPARRYQGAFQFKEAIERFERGTGTLFDGGAADPVPAPSKQYAVYANPAGATEAIKLGACWPVLFFGWVWMLYRRLYLQALMWFSLWILIVLLCVVAGSAAWADGDRRVGLSAALLLSGAIVAWLLPVFRGNRWCERALQRRGYSRVAQLPAATEAEAIAGAFREHAGVVR
jgi:Protein kinase domain/Protein of unknown function (DUF2628)